MSVSSAQSTLKQIEHEIERLKKTKSDEETKAAKLEKQITDKQREIEKERNASAIRSKQSQLKSLQDKRDRAKYKASEAGSKLVKQNVLPLHSLNILRQICQDIVVDPGVKISDC